MAKTPAINSVEEVFPKIMPKVSLLHGEEISFKCRMQVMPLIHLYIYIYMLSLNYKNIYVYTHIYFYVIVFVI